MDLTPIFEAVTATIVAFIKSGAIGEILAAAESALPYFERILSAVVDLVNG